MNELLLELVAKLEVMAPQVWQAAMRQVYVNAWVDGLLWAVPLAASALWFGWSWRHPPEDSYAKENWRILLAALGIVTIGLLMFWAFSLKPMLNPQWAAIQLLLRSLASAK